MSRYGSLDCGRARLKATCGAIGFEKGCSGRDSDAVRGVLPEGIGIEFDAIVGRESADINWRAGGEVAAKA